MRSWPPLTIATVGVRGPQEASVMLAAVEAGLRAGITDTKLTRLRIQLMNMRWRAFVEGWGGWNDGGWQEALADV